MDAQTVVVLLIVLAAVSYTVLRGVRQARSIRAKKSGADCGCDGCSH